jgi:hypothetical protein
MTRSSGRARNKAQRLLRPAMMLPLKSYSRIICFYALLTLAFFAPVLFAEDRFAPIGKDFVNFNYPNDLFAARSLKQGEVPLWNPYLAAGQPYAADPNIGFFYPLRIAFLLAPFSYQSMIILAAFHYFLAGLYTYAVARDMGARLWGSLAAGIAFMYSGFLVGQMDHINIIFSATWMPLTFLLCRRAILRQESPYALGAGLTLSLAVLGGHQQFALFSGYWCTVWFGFYLVKMRGQGLLRSSILLGSIFIVAGAGAAVQVAPSLEFLQHTVRTALTVDQAAWLRMPPIAWINLLFPHFLGQTDTQSAFFWQFDPHVNEYYVYVGVVTAFGALIGSYVWKSWEKRFLATMIILGFFLTAGAVTPVYRLAFEVIPGMQYVRVPGRFVLWVDMSLVLLSAFGLDWLLSHLKDHRHVLCQDVIKLLALGVAIGLLFWLIYPFIALWQVPQEHPIAEEITRYRLTDALIFAALMLAMLLIVLLTRFRTGFAKLAPFLWLALVMIDLFRAQQPRHFTTHNYLAHFEHPEIIELWRNDSSFFRVDYMSEVSRGSTDEFETNTRWNVLAGYVHGFPQVLGLPWNPFDLQSYYDFIAAIDRDSLFYDFLGVKYLVTLKGQQMPEKWIHRYVETPALAVYENSQALPHAFMVYASVVETEKAEALASILQESFDPATTVLLEKGRRFVGPVGNAQVEVLQMTNNSLALLVETNQPGYLVVSDAYFPGWRVVVNGDEKEILRANYSFRAVFLGIGRSSVRFEYRSVAIAWGAFITLLTWLGVGLFVLLRFIRSGRIDGNRPRLLLPVDQDS